jgi:hypothetical protein
MCPPKLAPKRPVAVYYMVVCVLEQCLEDGIQCSNIVCHDRTEMEYISGFYMTLALQNHREMGLPFAKVKCCLEDVDISPVDKGCV